MTSVRLMARALSAIGMLGITLAVVGVYGVVACLVSHRRREFGIMKALGATDRRLYGLMAREGLWMLLRGIVPGLLAAAGVGFALRGFLVGIPPYDWVTFIVVPAGLLVVGLAACVMPVAQVIRRDPLAVLREL
jgi:ABC-type antimicrobial peptide transport system permease subunit